MEKKTIDIIRDTMKKDEQGNITFSIDQGRGRGRKIVIPSDQIRSFIELINEKSE